MAYGLLGIEAATNVNSSSPVSDYHWLVEGEGRKWLSEIESWDLPLHTMTDRLRAHLSARQTHLVLEQLQLRRRAQPRFSRADEMFFTPRALEQATDEQIAAYKAGRFPPDIPRADGCCGIGGDLLALGLGGETVGYEQDPIVAYLAAANCERLARRRCRVVPADVSRIRFAPDWALHIDPDRRPMQRRSVQLDHHEPSRSTLARLIRTQPFAAVKLAPATAPNDPLLRESQLEWIGRGRECPQLVAWFGLAADRSGNRIATLLDAEGRPTSLVATEAAPLIPADVVDDIVVEPHAAVLAAGLAGVLAEQLHLCALTANGGYLTGKAEKSHPFATMYSVLEVTVARRSHLRRLVQKHRIGQLEVKTRGVSLDPKEVRRSLLLEGPEAGVLLLTRLANRQIAILARRI